MEQDAINTELYKSLAIMISRTKGLISRANDAMGVMSDCPNCRHETSVLLDGMGCIGTDIENAKKVLARAKAGTDPEAWRPCHIPGYEQRIYHGHLETRPIAR